MRVFDVIHAADDDAVRTQDMLLLIAVQHQTANSRHVSHHSSAI